MSTEDYIEAYKDMAITEMLRSGVPASITLSQGLLESSNGNSPLAIKANNHFGIKCHNGWKGETFLHNDDIKHDCFRKYDSVLDSYRDHSDFLRASSRYASLFELDITDYKGWAHGLKRAGYATNPSYPQLLIKIIEENQLHKYDLLASAKGQKRQKENQTEVATQKKTSQKNADVNFAANLKTRIKQINRIDYIVVQKGESFESLQENFGLRKAELYRYNDMEGDARLHEGDRLYLHPKRNRAEAGNDFHVIEKGETMLDVSQLYGVKLSNLYKRNRIEPGTEPETGDRIYLRKRVKGAKEEEQVASKKKEKVEEGDSPKIKFEFN